ncbi:MAG: hypothetical protein CMK92_00775, partial [Pseudomonas sp.]|nr:hypothetical protein [Pseudomonas sp.]
YKYAEGCRKNDGGRVHYGTLAEVKHAIGLWGYVINGAASAARMIEAAMPSTRNIDHQLSEAGLYTGKLRGFARIPSIIFHPGTFQIESFGYTVSTPATGYISDTNYRRYERVEDRHARTCA